jgi:hypothetical protein
VQVPIPSSNSSPDSGWVSGGPAASDGADVHSAHPGAHPGAGDATFRAEDGTFVYASSHKPKRVDRLKAGPRRPETPVITKAQTSYDEQLRSRKKRYLIMMSFRVPCLVGAALLYQTPWLALLVLAVSIPLPWCAVLIANDRPAQKRPKRVAVPTVSYERALPPSRLEIVEGTTTTGPGAPRS